MQLCNIYHIFTCVLQCIAAVCCSALQRVIVEEEGGVYRESERDVDHTCMRVCCSMLLQCAVCCSVLQGKKRGASAESIQLCIHMYKLCIHIYITSREHSSVHTYVHAYIYITYILTCIHTYIHICVYINIYIYIYICIYIYIYTYI